MDQDFSGVNIKNIDELLNFIDSSEFSKVNTILKTKFSGIVSLLKRVDYKKYSIHIEDLIDELQLILYSRSTNNEESITIAFREKYYTKFYIQDCKFLITDFYKETEQADDLHYNIIETMLKGDYNIKLSKSKNVVVSNEISILGITKKNSYGFFNFLKKIDSLDKKKGNAIII